MVYDVEITEIKGNIASLQKDMAEIKAIQPLLKETLERNVSAYERLADTLHEIEKSMISLNDKIDSQSKDIEDIKKEMNENEYKFNKKLSNVEAKIHSVDDEGKFNIREFFKNYFPWIIILLGFGFNIISKFVQI